MLGSEGFLIARTHVLPDQSTIESQVLLGWRLVLKLPTAEGIRENRFPVCLPVNTQRVTLVRDSQVVPARLHGNDPAGRAVELVPLHAGEQLNWRLEQGSETEFLDKITQ